MILCVTPNVALDKTLVVPGYGAGGVFRPQQIVAAAGGKGVNVARVVKLLGREARCYGFIAGHTGAMVADRAAAEGLDAQWTVVESGETRTCTILVDPALEQTTVVNESGMETTTADWRHLADTLKAAAADVQTICFCGSLPPGTTLDSWIYLLADLRDMGKTVWVDSSGLGLAVASDMPGVGLKINDEEASSLMKKPVTTVSEVAAAAMLRSQWRGAPVVITMGSRGAVYSDGKTLWHAIPPTIEAKSAVGSGDSFLAGLLVGLETGETPDQALRRAVAAGAANALSIGGGQFALDDFTAILSNTTVAEHTPG